MQSGNAQQMARKMMDDHSLDGWSFEYDNAKRRMGLCQVTHRVISLSRYYVEAADETHVRETMLHEIAHALVGRNDRGHGYVWRAKYREIGGVGGRTAENPYRQEQRDAGALPWIGTCPLCGYESTRSRRPVRVVSCPKHNGFREEAVFTWTYYGVPQSPSQIHHKYNSEWRLIFGSAVPSLPVLSPRVAMPEFSAAASPGHVSLVTPLLFPVLWPGKEVRIANLPGARQYAGRVVKVYKVGRSRMHFQDDGQVITIPFTMLEDSN